MSRTVIIPAGGLGKRMESVTGGAAKEMLELDGRPVMGWILDEVQSLEPDQVVVITSPGKDNLDAYVASRGTNAQLRTQFRADGLGSAIALGADKGDVLVLLPDSVFMPQSPSRRIARALEEGFDIVIATETVSDDEVTKFGIVESSGNGEIARILEKPGVSETLSRAAVAGRYGFSEAMMRFIVDQVKEANDEGEIGITPIINAAIENGYDALELPCHTDERRFDCGSPAGYAAAKSTVQ